MNMEIYSTRYPVRIFIHPQSELFERYKKDMFQDETTGHRYFLMGCLVSKTTVKGIVEHYSGDLSPFLFVNRVDMRKFNDTDNADEKRKLVKELPESEIVSAEIIFNETELFNR